MLPTTSLLPLNVPVDTAIQFIKDVIADGQTLINNYSRGQHNPSIALQHSINVGKWAHTNADRINSLFASQVVHEVNLTALGGETLNLAALNQLLLKLAPPPPPKQLPLHPVPPDAFTVIAPARIMELLKLQSNSYDFAKLIRLCEELNTAYANGCFFATVMITRAIIDHVPPVFGLQKFAHVANNYSGAQSFKEAMTQLDLMDRNIADLYLHEHIRSAEALPLPQQVNFGPALDLLLQEIVRITP